MVKIAVTSSRLEMETRRLTVLGFLLTLAVAVMLPSPSLAKPKLVGPDEKCAVPTKCSGGTNAICAQLYCDGLREKCKGKYKSGKCKDTKDLHDIQMCSLAKKGCGRTLPQILRFGRLEIWLGDGEVFVVTNPDDDQLDFEAIFDDAAEFLTRAEEKASRPEIDPQECLKRCLSQVSKESSAACPQICDPEQY